jgi:hypothetical protein
MLDPRGVRRRRLDIERFEPLAARRSLLREWSRTLVS